MTQDPKIKAPSSPTKSEFEAMLERAEQRLSRKAYNPPTLTEVRTDPVPAGVAQLALDRASYHAIKDGKDHTTPLHPNAPEATVTATKALHDAFETAAKTIRHHDPLVLDQLEAVEVVPSQEGVTYRRLAYDPLDSHPQAQDDPVAAPSNHQDNAAEAPIYPTKVRLAKALDHITSFADLLLIYCPQEELHKAQEAAQQKNKKPYQPLQTVTLALGYGHDHKPVTFNTNQEHASINDPVLRFPSNLLADALEHLSQLGYVYSMTAQEGLVVVIRPLDPSAVVPRPN